MRAEINIWDSKNKLELLSKLNVVLFVSLCLFFILVVFSPENITVKFYKKVATTSIFHQNKENAKSFFEIFWHMCSSQIIIRYLHKRHSLLSESCWQKMSKNVNDLKGKNRIFPNGALTFCQNSKNKSQRAFFSEFQI